MPIGPFEKEVMALLARHRNPESFIGGATVLNQAPNSPRTSEDIDVFHDTESALTNSLAQDLPLLELEGYQVSTLFSAPSFCRAQVRKNGSATKLEWVYDSAFRFFPIEPDPELGYRLNFWDAAANKVLAGVGRGVIRDYVDLLHLHKSHLSLGALIWAAAGKDLGLNPHFICGELKRTHQYPPSDYASLKMESVDATEMRIIWRKALDEAETLFENVLQDAPYGCFFLDSNDHPQTPTPETLSALQPHFGSIRGCWPRIIEDNS
jgi:hypothetical protein